MNAPLHPPANPVAKALWYIENNFAGELMLDEIANVAGVSRYHVSRAFGEAIGRPITGYVRGRRLTEPHRRRSLTVAREFPGPAAVPPHGTVSRRRRRA